MGADEIAGTLGDLLCAPPLARDLVGLALGSKCWRTSDVMEHRSQHGLVVSPGCPHRRARLERVLELGHWLAEIGQISHRLEERHDLLGGDRVSAARLVAHHDSSSIRSKRRLMLCVSRSIAASDVDERPLIRR